MTMIVLVLNTAIFWRASFLLLPATWRRRARFRRQLRADIAHAPDFLRDIGIDVSEAQAEAMRFFWEPVQLQREIGQAAPPPAGAANVAPDHDGCVRIKPAKFHESFGRETLRHAA